MYIYIPTYTYFILFPMFKMTCYIYIYVCVFIPADSSTKKMEPVGNLFHLLWPGKSKIFFLFVELRNTMKNVGGGWWFR